MATEDRVKAWLDFVQQDIGAGEVMLKNGYWLYVAFTCHQAVEKLIKAYWVATRDDEPPYVHDHKRLLTGCGLYAEMDDERKRFIERMVPMYIAARYPESKRRIAATLNQESCIYIIEQTKQFEKWILQKLSPAMRPSNSSESISE